MTEYTPSFSLVGEVRFLRSLPTPYLSINFDEDKGTADQETIDQNLWLKEVYGPHRSEMTDCPLLRVLAQVGELGLDPLDRKKRKWNPLAKRRLP